MSFDRDFSVMVTPEGQRVPLMHYQNLILIDIELNEGEPETATPEPAPSLPDSATPRVSRGLAVGSFLAAALAFVAVSLDAVIEPIRGLRQRECFEASFAGCGAMADAFRADSGVVAGMLERDPAKLPLLRAAHRHAQFHLDYEDTSWASFSWSNGALRVVLGGPPCQPVAPTGKRLGIGDPRSAALLGFVNIFRRLQPHMAVLEDTCKYYGLPVPRGVHKCAACRVSNLTRARTYHTSRGAETSHRVTFEFDIDGPVATQSRDGAKYLLVGVTQTRAGHYVYAAGQRRKSDFVGDDDVPSTFRALHASLKSRGIEIGTAVFDFGGEFNSVAADAMLAQLGVAYRPRASDQHVDRVESEHRRIYEGMRPAILTSGAPANLWLDCALDRCDKSNCFARDGVTPHEALFQSVPDTSTLVPFYPHIYDNLGHDSRHDSRGIAARYPVVCT